MIRSSTLLVAQTAVIYGGLVVAGWWVRRLLTGPSPAPRFPAAIFGIVVVAIAAWYWSTVVDRGLDALWPWVLGLSVGAAGVIALKERLNLLHEARRAWPIARVNIAAGVGSVALTVVQADELLARGPLSFSSQNMDVATYVLAAQHVGPSGSSATGWVSGIDLGLMAEIDVHGAISFLNFAHWLTAYPYFKMVLATMAVACVLLAQACAQLLRTRTSLSDWSVAALALIPQSCFMFVHVARQYFLSQVLAMALTVCIVTVALHVQNGALRERWPDLASASLFVAGLLLVYPHMAFLVIPIVGGVLVIRSGFRPRESLRALVVLAIPFAVGFLLVPTRLIGAVDRLRVLGTTQAGYPLPGFTPLALAGFQTSLDETVSATSIVGSVVLLMAAALAAWRLRSGDAGAWTFPAIPILVCCLGSYAVIYFARGGPTFTQWKWVTFFQPLIVLAIYAPLAQLLAFRWRNVAGVVVAALAVVAILNVGAEKASAPLNTTSQWISPDFGRLGDAPALGDIDEVNVMLPAGEFDTMWAASILGPRRVATLSPAYWAASPPTAVWTLVPSSDIPVSQPSRDVRRLNDTFALIRQPTKQTSLDSVSRSEVGVMLDSLEVDAGQQVTGTAVVTNTGLSTWLSSGTVQGSVNLGVREVSATNEPLSELPRISLVPFPFSIGPGATIETRFALPPLPPGKHRLQFETVAEGVTWFGGAEPSPVVTVAVG